MENKMNRIDDSEENRERRKKLLERWGAVLDFDSSTPRDRLKTAIMIESQEHWIRPKSDEVEVNNKATEEKNLPNSSYYTGPDGKKRKFNMAEAQETWLRPVEKSTDDASIKIDLEESPIEAIIRFRNKYIESLKGDDELMKESALMSYKLVLDADIIHHKHKYSEKKTVDKI